MSQLKWRTGGSLNLAELHLDGSFNMAVDISARYFFKLYPDIKKKYFWGSKLWTQSYFVETIGNANEELIRASVKNQLTKMDKLN